MNDPHPIIVVNLKANKSSEQMAAWLDEFSEVLQSFQGTIVVCPSFPILTITHPKIEEIKKNKSINIHLGSQDVSQFEQGPYTGEVAASQLKGLCTFAIIGHSERRQNFSENQETLTKKVKNAKNAGLEPIFCVQDQAGEIPEGVTTVAYEPIFAIGTGNPDTPENADQVAAVLKQKRDVSILYGGSVTPDNIRLFTEKENIAGAIVGSGSLDPQNLIKIIHNSI